jgi:hypothetical protein
MSFMAYLHFFATVCADDAAPPDEGRLRNAIGWTA